MSSFPVSAGLVISVSTFEDSATLTRAFSSLGCGGCEVASGESSSFDVLASFFSLLHASD